MFEVLELLSCGRSLQEILTHQPLLNENHIRDCIQFGARLAAMLADEPPA